MKKTSLPKRICLILILLMFSLTLMLNLTSCVSGGALRAEEYFTIGMAFFELGRFSDAEFWLNRARSADRTMVASEYNLGRIAFETGRFEDAARYFERVLAFDPYNVMALRAAAFSRIRNADFELADALYSRVLALIPESADDGFNHALVLFGMGRYAESEEVLNRFPFALEERASSILLLARAQKAQGKVEAIDSYARWLLVKTGPPNPMGIFEFGQVLENAGFYARALEQYEDALEALERDVVNLRRSTIRFARARLLLTADPYNEEGITELNAAVREGFTDREAVEALIADTRVIPAHREEITRILAGIAVEDDEDEDDEEDEDEDDEDDDDEDPWSFP